MEDTGRERRHGKKTVVVPPPPSLHHPSSLSILLPSPCSPNPLAAGCTAEGQWEKERREAEGNAGVGCVDVQEHADRRACGRAMTAMLSPKIRQTRRGRFTLSAFTWTEIHHVTSHRDSGESFR